jgi:hypothetical protein
MAVDTWPATLPQLLLVEGYADGVADGRIISNTDAGPPKVRRRSSAMPRPVQGRMIMDTDQLADLRDFVDNTLIGGALPFNFPDPVDGSTVIVLFADSLPVWSAYGADTWNVNLSLWIMP